METVVTIQTAIQTVGDAPKTKSAKSPSVIKVKAAYLLTEAGRKAALLMGRNGRERQTAVVRIATHRMHLVTVDAQGVSHLKLRPRYEDRGDHVVRVDALPVFDHPMTGEELLLAASKNYELEQKWRTQRVSKTLGLNAGLHRREQIADAFLADRSQRAVEHPAPNPAWCYLRIDGKRMLFDATQGSSVCRKVPAEAHRRFQADLRARRWRNQQRRTSEEAVNQEKKRFVGEWIERFGTPDQQARQRAGVLPLTEAIEAITEHLFAGARGCRLYAHDGAACLQEHLRKCPQFSNAVVANGDLIHKFEDAKDVTAEGWQRAHEIQRLLPAAKVTVRFHRLLWRKDLRAPAVTRYSVLAVQTLGPLTLRREYEAT